MNSGKWVIKASYPHGGHVYRAGDGNTPRYENEQQARAACEVLNAVNRVDGLSYIAVQEEGYYAR